MCRNINKAPTAGTYFLTMWGESHLFEGQHGHGDLNFWRIQFKKASVGHIRHTAKTPLDDTV